MRKKITKKGAEKIFSVYWFAILIIVAGGIFVMVYTFYHHPYDVREVEANIMVNRIADCLSEGGYLKKEIRNNGTFLLDENNFLGVCLLNFDVENKWDEGQYYTQINFYNIEDTDNAVFDIAYGNQKWISSCEIQKDKEHERLAKCVEGRFYSLDENKNQYLIKILSVVRKTEKNAE